MKDLMLLIISGIGLTYVVTRSFLFKEVREKATNFSLWLGKLISCPQCFGIYAGIIVYLCKELDVLDILLYGLSVSGVCYLIDKKI